MARRLGINSSQRAAFRRELRGLERSGAIARIRKNRYVLPSEADLVTGTISIHQAGFGFLASEKPGEPDIFVAAENTGTAMHGDRVVARINRDVAPRRRSDRGLKTEGRVIRILERAHDTLVGTLQQSRNFHYVIPDDPRLVHNIYVAPAAAAGHRRKKDATEGRRSPASAESRRDRQTAATAPRPGDKVVVRLISWESRHVNPEGEIVEVLGPADAPGVDLLSIVRNFHLPTEFPKSVRDEANRIPTEVPASALNGREDLRSDFIITIDPDDARDFDDAINVEKLTSGGWELGVHIADVAAYVTPGTALDREARRRGNSVYLPDRVIPMLPERLSNGVCSLNPGVDRLTHSVFVQFDQNANVKKVRFARSVIRSAHRLTYKQAYALLKGSAGDELTDRLHRAWELAALLRKKRFQHGSLELDFPEIKVRLDKNGKPIALERIENDESHQLIEEFMLVANEQVARELRNRGIPTIYRVHEDPDPEKLGEYREFILSHGYKVGDLSVRSELQRFLATIKDKPEEPALKVGLLKSLRRAHYLPKPLGHYGLAKSNYLHFTSPIRRYADLVAHRSLAGMAKGGRSAAEVGDLASLSEHISATERNAAEAEIEAVKMKKLEFFEQQLAQRNPQVFRAVVTDVRNYGLVIELPDVVMSGLVHISSLTDDFYVFDNGQRRLIGRRSRRRLQVGDDLRVYVSRVDRFKRQIDFALADERQTVTRSRRRTR
ncbi:MAG TPA: ribonuclease R [Chthoniobacterales bacterium]|nr:ribonuclease R [Chthoniobacterales bacterium]